MRAELWASIVLLVLPATSQRGMVEGVRVDPSPVEAGATVSITVTGTNPCGAVNLDYGDATEAITHPLTRLPATIEYTYARPGDYRIRARGMGNCDGDVSTGVRVTRPVNLPRSEMRFREMDADGDGVIIRSEWRGSAQSFREQDWNSDGVLSGREVAVGAAREGRGRGEEADLPRTPEAFDRLDSNRNGVITPNEWPHAQRAFEQIDGDGDGVLTRREFVDRDAAVRRTPDGQIIVESTRAWTDTGVFVRQGEIVRIATSGSVQLSGDSRDVANPAGTRSGRRAPAAPLPGRAAGALIARVGGSAPIFVGAAESFRAPASGQLYLGVNDDHLEDNRGEFHVRIDTARRDR